METLFGVWHTALFLSTGVVDCYSVFDYFLQGTVLLLPVAVCQEVLSFLPMSVFLSTRKCFIFAHSFITLCWEVFFLFVYSCIFSWGSVLFCLYLYYFMLRGILLCLSLAVFLSTRKYFIFVCCFITLFWEVFYFLTLALLVYSEVFYFFIYGCIYFAHSFITLYWEVFYFLTIYYSLFWDILLLPWAS